MSYYTNLARIRNYFSLASYMVEDDGQLMFLIGQASRSIDTYTRRLFYPKRETRFYDYAESRQIRLDQELLSLETLKTQNGASTVASGVLFLATGREWNRPPYDRIVLKSNSGSVLNYSGTPQRANEVTGIWGYHEDYTNAWVDTGTSLAASMAANAKTIELAGAGSAGTGASDANYDHPRVSPGDLLKIGDEFLFVSGGAASGNGTVNLRPAMHGTAGASHAAGASIARFAPEPDIQMACIEWAAWSFARQDTPFQSKQSFPQAGEVNVSVSMPASLRDKLNRFVSRTVETIPG